MTLDDAQQMAHRALPGLWPWEFWRLTPVELAMMLEGAAWRQQRTMRREAWKLAHLLNVSGKSLRRSISPEKLLGEPEPERNVRVRDPVTNFRALWQRHQGRLHGAGGNGDSDDH